MKSVALLFLFAATGAQALTNEDLKLKPPRVIFDSQRSMSGAMACFDEGTDIWVRYFQAPDHRTYRKPESIEIEFLTAPATIFAIQNRAMLVSIKPAPKGSHIEIWGAAMVDELDPTGAASRGHAALRAKKNGRLQQSIDSFKMCLEQSDPVVASGMPAAPPMSIAEELSKLADLKAKGILTQAEFDAQKAKLLAGK